MYTYSSFNLIRKVLSKNTYHTEPSTFVDLGTIFRAFLASSIMSLAAYFYIRSLSSGLRVGWDGTPHGALT